jgi:class 3 adenylate cyclase
MVQPAPASEPVSYTPPHLAEKILTSRSALEGERKQVTVLFIDIANSTPLAEQLGPEAMHTLLNQFFALLLEEVHCFEGTANQFLGDGAMCLFGAPIAHEDHARRAVLAALGIQRRVQAWRPEMAKQYEVDFAVRMGLNSGLVVVGSIGDNLRMDYSAIGDTTNVSARLQAIAAPGTILVTDATARLVQGTIRLEPLPPVTVKGKEEPVGVFNVIGPLPQRSPISSRGDRTLSTFVGRERELATLDELLIQVENGQGQVVGIVAEAGQGKSRLLYEFRERLEGKPVTYLDGRCLSYGQASPYHPITNIVRHHCGIVETDRPETISAKVHTVLQEVGMDPEQSAPYLLQLLGVPEGTEAIAMLTPEAVRMRTFATLRQMSVSGAQQHPLIVEVEDLHWVDQTSEAYLMFLVENLAGAKILLLTSYRPGYQPPWLDKSYATQLSLQHLAPQEALTIVHSTDPGGVLTDHLAQMIIKKAEGNPFFLEELTRTVAESGESTVEMAVPDTIQGVLSARIDRLPESDKQLLQTASVLGREFSLPLLQAIWEIEVDVKLVLQELRRQEFLFERSGDDEPLYVFKHALTQDVAYESLLNARRQDLHRTAGRALEQLYADRLEEVYYPLAYHYVKANEAEKAVAYLDILIDKAMQAYAYAEAVMMSQQALVQAEQLIDERDQTVIALAIRQAESLFWLGRRQESIDLLLSHQPRLEGLQNPQLAGQYYLWLGYIYCFQGERQLAQQHL